VAKVQVHRDPGLSARYPAGIPNRLTVTLADGKRLVREVEFPRGHARNPMTDSEVEAKFRSLVEPRYGKERADKILAMCWKLDELRSVGDLLQLFTRA
jgi:2-methylcitrate dehydratase